jgi:hypothetical protein
MYIFLDCILIYEAHDYLNMAKGAECSIKHHASTLALQDDLPSAMDSRKEVRTGRY